jgi:hypothetical protein
MNRGVMAAKSAEMKSKNGAQKMRETQCVRSQQADSPVAPILFLQRTIGNRGVECLYRAGLLQAKLQIGQPNDIYEQEADRVADQVMRMPGEKVDSRQSIVRRRGEVGGLKGKSLQMKPG